MADGTYRCARCRFVKPDDEFYACTRNRRRGRMSTCKVCFNRDRGPEKIPRRERPVVIAEWMVDE